MSELALLGGKPVINERFRPYNSIGVREKEAANRVLDSGNLSQFVGAWCDDFYGGPYVQQLEKAWQDRFSVAHAISVNSATSGLYAAIGAAGAGPGDEVIVPPYTMSATAMAPLVYGAIPVFADIEPDTFCLDIDAVRKCITPKTRAILVVDLFGHPARLADLRTLADQHGITLIEDNAQGPLATENGRYAGTIAHIGIFSLNYHKHFHAGEGGICVTDSDFLAKRLQMIRNHGENVVNELSMDDLSNMIGFNYRMTELTAAIALEQLRDAELHVGRRERIASALSEAVRDLDGITPPAVRDGCRHVYYVWAARFDEKQVGVSREIFARALTAEGFPNSLGYVEPLYMLPVFQKKIGIGSQGFPFNLSNRVYEKGMCPVVERMHEKELLEFHPCAFELENNQIEQLCEAFLKVFENREKLLHLENERAIKGGAVGTSSSKH
ncbi:MAG: DegT/DnrJ/EryC1/StrS family aminotransferase [Candidatus Melainabacteria bacterium]|nr:DegT/DnrJ/EryC1/StrS family aminotransferase [Candidatus Melainabacteria bacterium]